MRIIIIIIIIYYRELHNSLLYYFNQPWYRRCKHTAYDRVCGYVQVYSLKISIDSKLAADVGRVNLSEEMTESYFLLCLDNVVTRSSNRREWRQIIHSI